jgi:hypothetical protein
LFPYKSVVHQNKFGQPVKNIQIAFNITNHCSITFDHQKGKKEKKEKETEQEQKRENN